MTSAAGLSRFLPRASRTPTRQHRLSARHIFVFPNAAGLAFAGALLVMLIASINYSLSLGYALTFLLMGIAVVGLFHGFRNLFRLTIRPGRPIPVFCGETARFPLNIENTGHRRPTLYLRNAVGDSVGFDLDANRQTVVDLPCPTTRRGIQLPGRTVLETVWPLGIVRAWTVFVPDMQCLVYPAPERNPPMLPRAWAGHDLGRSSTEEGDEDFAGLRTHRPTDPPRRIAWKALARGGTMMTKQFSAEEGSDVLLDWHALPHNLDEEARLSRLTAWVVEAEQSGFRYALSLPGRNLTAGKGEAHKLACLRLLALYGLPHTEYD